MLLKKKLVTIAVTAALCISGVVGVVGAANTTDTEWSFYNQNTKYNTTCRQKYDNTNVYVYPKSGLTLEYTVQENNSGVYSYLRDIPVSIKPGIQATLKSDAVRYDIVRIEMTNSITGNYGYTTGVWSPDSTQYYTVY